MKRVKHSSGKMGGLPPFFRYPPVPGAIMTAVHFCSRPARPPAYFHLLALFPLGPISPPLPDRATGNNQPITVSHPSCAPCSIATSSVLLLCKGLGSFRFKDLFVRHWISSAVPHSLCWSLLTYHRPATLPHSLLLFLSTRQHEFCPNMIDLLPGK